MSVWANIEMTSQDQEIMKINELEERLGELSENVRKVRELITRHEVCHFKYKQHIQNIKDSIINLEPKVATENIGKNHIQHGENAWEHDRTGKSLLGQQYIWAIKSWMEDLEGKDVPEKFDPKIGEKVRGWLRKKTDAKTGLIRLLLARLTWDWKALEDLQLGGELEELEFQICRIDICHYAFAENLERLIKGIGILSPVENFEGCGSFNHEIQEFVHKEINVLMDQFKSFYNDKNGTKDNQIKAWLTACLMKTLKEQVKLSEPEIGFEISVA